MEENKERWYIVNTFSGREHKVAAAIHEYAQKQGCRDKFLQIIVPTHNVAEVKKGKKVTTKKQIFPGYILLQLILNDETWNLVKNIRDVIDFMGIGNKPSPLTEDEAKRILSQIEEGVDVRGENLVFEVGETIKITDGPFESFSGVIEEVDFIKNTVKVSVLIFGRATPVELGFNQVQKI